MSSKIPLSLPDERSGMHVLSVRFSEPMWRLIVTEAREEGVSASGFVREAVVAQIWYTRGARDLPFGGGPAYEADREGRSIQYGLVVGAATRGVDLVDDEDEVRGMRPTDATGDMSKHLVRLGRQTWLDVASEARLSGIVPSQWIREAASSRALYLRALRDPRTTEMAEALGEDIAFFRGNYAAMLQRLQYLGKLPHR